MKNLKLDKLANLVQTYGAKLYKQGESLGSVVVGQEGVTIDGDALVLPVEGGTMYVPFRRGIVGEEGKTYELHVFTAERDANGTYNGEEWSVTKGHEKVFAS